MSHYMPTDNAEVTRLRTGYERVIAHRTTSTYSKVAKMDGKVIEIDDKIKMCKVKYKDGSIEAFNYGNVFGICSDVTVLHKLTLNLKVGDYFKKDDIICYNEQFFEKDPFTNQVDLKHGILANVAIMEIPETFEDSSYITDEFSKKLTINPIAIRPITFTNDTHLHYFKKIGERVDVNDDLIVYEKASPINLENKYKANSTLEYIAKLNKKTPRAKYAGTIVDIEVYTSSTQLDPSILEFIKYVYALKKKRYEFAKNTESNQKYRSPSLISDAAKFKGVNFDENTVMIRYFIKEDVPALAGDKIVVDSSLKSVISSVQTEKIESESGTNIDVIFSGSSISNRIICSPMVVGISERILQKLEDDIIADYFE